MHPKDLSIHDFNYTLPDEKIARFPLEKRDSSKLLVYRNDLISDVFFSDLPAQLDENDLVIFNQTRVVQARLIFHTETGASIEVFCLEPLHGITIPEAMLQREQAEWLCMVGRVKKWKPNSLLSLALDDEHKDILQVALVDRLSDGFAIRFTWNNPEKCFADVLDQAGFLPLPPYLKREAELDDKQRYQTVYAIDKGSVAAPTAGLHFTDDVLRKLKEKQIDTAFLTLHVGAGTFKPVKADRMEDHEMHAEEVIASLDIIEKIAHCRGRIIAVGTTSMRSLESLYWTAVQLMKSESKDLTIRVDQWEPYSFAADVLPSRKEAFGFLETHLKEKNVSHISGETQIIIAPGYSVKVVDALVTNFHQPHSTLLLLVSACIGEQWRDVYTHALAHEYRFLSYGDSSLLFIK
ncbi:MAG: hypothetical protein RLZZ543_1903 [Bacteroidota bacterium]|jgi:S-adenosylmethionine:tRNA ribosyltransferase-isomerase